jgi:hypothetical protein
MGVNVVEFSLLVSKVALMLQTPRDMLPICMFHIYYNGMFRIKHNMDMKFFMEASEIICNHFKKIIKI